MHEDLKDFAATWLRVAAAALVPVLFAAFVSLPHALGRHPGEAHAAAEAPGPSDHMT